MLLLGYSSCLLDDLQTRLPSVHFGEVTFVEEFPFPQGVLSTKVCSLNNLLFVWSTTRPSIERTFNAQ